MLESILTSIKKLLGIEATDTDFDDQVIMHINTVFKILWQIGAGPDNPYKITSAANTWNEFLNSSDQLEDVKTYIYAKVKKIFDPPQSASHMAALNETINECEWRISVTVDPRR